LLKIFTPHDWQVNFIYSPSVKSIQFVKYEDPDLNDSTYNDNNGDNIKPPAIAIYYYHSDHLGTNNIVTNMNGNIYQYFGNLPFGETIWDALGSNIHVMEKTIYIKLLEEGTKVYKPVPAIKIENNIYKVQGFQLYDPEDEVWEFLPGSYVIVEEQSLNGDSVLVATKSITHY
jgi:hypothetical protein